MDIALHYIGLHHFCIPLFATIQGSNVTNAILYSLNLNSNCCATALYGIVKLENFVLQYIALYCNALHTLQRVAYNALDRLHCNALNALQYIHTLQCIAYMTIFVLHCIHCNALHFIVIYAMQCMQCIAM